MKAGFSEAESSFGDLGGRQPNGPNPFQQEGAAAAGLSQTCFHRATIRQNSRNLTKKMITDLRAVKIIEAQ